MTLSKGFRPVMPSAAPRLTRYPDPLLNEAAEPVTAFNGSLASLAADLAAAIDAAPAVGLAAPHIGVLARLIAVRPADGGAIRHYVNPVVEWASEETETHEEGSVSMPGVSAGVTRPKRIRIRYRTLDGAETTEEAEGFAAAVLQHEIDQLDGIFWIDRLSRLRRERLVKRFRKLG